MFDIDQYVDIFLDESRENLENLNQNLLELEKEPENIELVNEIFRIAHTLKGMSGTMGFERVARLTHRMENILDKIRSHKLAINTYILDAMFEGLDRLEEFIKNIESTGKEGDVAVDELITRLEDIEAGKLDSKEEKAEVKIDKNVEQSVVSEDIEYLNNVIKSAKEQNLESYSVKVVLDENCMLKSARAFLVFKAIEEDGEILHSEPAIEDIEDENFEFEFSLVTITSQTKEEIEKKLRGISEVKDVLVDDYNQNSLISVDNSKETEKEDIVEEKEETLSDEKEIKEEKIVVPAPKPKDSSKDEHDDDEKSAKRKGKIGKTVRVDIDRLDNLMNLVSELIIVKTRLEDIDISNNSNNHNINEAIEYLETITTNLHDAVTKVRMVPIERVFNRFPRMIRDLSKELNKELELIMSGEETEVDRTVIDELGDPLIHLLRNSIDHGIETPEIRRSLNKKEIGKVELLAYPDGNNVVIEVVDDGSGLNTEKIKQKALDKNLISKETASIMDANEINNLIFMPGFSTADKISNVSGRGVGLDVVKTKIEALGGTVEIESQKNVGSKFIIRLPLTLAIIQALLVTIGSEKYAIPLNNIKEITDIRRDKIRIVEGKEIVLYRGKTLPLVDLGKVLSVEERKEVTDEVSVIIVKKGDKDLGIIVDGLIGQQEIVIKSLGKYLKSINFIAGATILGNGSVALIVDTNSLF